MPTFTYENNAASNSGVILLEVPDVAWFKDSVMSAIAEMTIPENWFGDDLDYEKYAVLQANLMMATYKVLNFNPFPVGMIIAYGGETPPGYLPCDGNPRSGLEYPELYSVIGETYGNSGGEGYFDLPYLEGSFTLGKSDEFDMGTFQGSNTVSIGVNNLPSHTHDDGGHSHGIQLTTDGLAVAPGELPVVVPIPIIPGSTDTGFAQIQYTGGDEPFNNIPSSVVVNYIIYAGR